MNFFKLLWLALKNKNLMLQFGLQELLLVVPVMAVIASYNLYLGLSLFIFTTILNFALGFILYNNARLLDE
jgi:hypothetical protein